jgi:hypothetical protein
MADKKAKKEESLVSLVGDKQVFDPYGSDSHAVLRIPSGSSE